MRIFVSKLLFECTQHAFATFQPRRTFFRHTCTVLDTRYKTDNAQTIYKPTSVLCLKNVLQDQNVQVPNLWPRDWLFKIHTTTNHLLHVVGHVHIILLSYRLLRDKRMMDESFNSFLELKRGAARHTLESLMLLPVCICIHLVLCSCVWVETTHLKIAKRAY